jgi:hypothetical protein
MGLENSTDCDIYEKLNLNNVVQKNEDTCAVG